MWLAEASRVTPGLRAIYPGVPEPPPAPPEAVRIRVAEALLRMLECIADGGPLLLVFDSVQHLDPASQDVLHVLARRLETSPILLVGTMQSDEIDHAMIGVAAESGIEWQQQVHLRGLGAARTRALVTQLMPESEHVPVEIVNDIAELSQGNPYLTEMLVSDWRNNGGDSLVALERQQDAAAVSWRPPGTMRLAFAKQYQGLSKDAQHMLHLLAVASRVIATDELETLLAFAPAALDHAALELIDRSLIRTDSGRLGFRNELHRAFVYYHEMSEEARKYHHARLAKCLTTTGAERDFQRALEASHHYLKAKMVDEAIEAVCLGAELAVTRGAPKEAERALKAVLSSCNIDSPSRLHLLLARAQSAEGKYHQALNALVLWNPTAPTTLQKAQAAIIRTEALHRGRLADDRSIQQALGEALALADAAGDERLAMRALQLSAEVASEVGSWQAIGTVRMRAARVEHASVQPDTKALARFTQGYCLLVAGDVRGAQSQFVECLRLLGDLSLDGELRQAFNGLGVAQYCLGLFADGIASFNTAIRIASHIGDSVACATSWSNLGAVHEDLGDFTEAEHCYEQAMSLEAQASNPRRAVEVHLNMASLRLVTGDLKDASRCLKVARKRASESQLWWLTTDVLLAQADYNIAINCPEAAWPLVEEAQTNTRGRVYLLSNRGRFERLRRHHLWITRGRSAVETLSDTENLSERCIQLSGRFEINAMEDWVRLHEGIPRSTSMSAFDELRSRQLHGILSRLNTLQIRDQP
jgi:tetratricopeptide (TPR) repeat protein